MDQTLITSIKEAREGIEHRGRAVLVLIELGEAGRVARGRKIPHLVRGLVSDSSGISAGVMSEDRKNLYQVLIQIHCRPGGQEVLRGSTCTCYDNGRAGSCKHILAVAIHWIDVYREDWNRLKNAETALSTTPATEVTP